MCVYDINTQHVKGLGSSLLVIEVHAKNVEKNLFKFPVCRRDIDSVWSSILGDRKWN